MGLDQAAIGSNNKPILAPNFFRDSEMPDLRPLLPTVRDIDPLRGVAFLFNLGSNLKRLYVLKSLAESGRTLTQLAVAVGIDKKSLNQHLHALEEGMLVRCEQNGKQRAYELTGRGQTFFQVLETMLGEAAAKPAVVPADVPAQGLNQLNALLKTFADPVRLRLLSLLAGAQEVCVCYLHEALQLPQSTVSRHIAQLRVGGLIVGRRDGTWIYYRLTKPADDLHRVLLNHLVPVFSLSQEFKEDKERLKKLVPCSEKQ